MSDTPNPATDQELTALDDLSELFEAEPTTQSATVPGATTATPHNWSGESSTATPPSLREQSSTATPPNLRPESSTGSPSISPTPTTTGQDPQRHRRPAPTNVRNDRPAVIDLSGRGLNSRKLMTTGGAIPLKKASHLPGLKMKELIASGEISEDDATALLDALHKNHTVLVSDDLQSLTGIVDAARSDMQSSSTVYPVVHTALNLKSLPETVFQVLSARDAHILIGSSSEGDPVEDLHRLLLLAGSQLALADLRQMLIPGVALALHRSKPRLRQVTSQVGTPPIE